MATRCLVRASWQALASQQQRSPHPRQRGYTLVEIMIALLIAIFLLAGLDTLVAGTRRTSTNQTSLAVLQDEERLAMSMLNDVIQTAGYFDSNTYSSAAIAFPTAATTTGGPSSPGNPSLAVGQVIGGLHASNAVPDTLVVRYGTTGTASANPDSILNCNGGSSTSAASFVNYFFVQAASGSGATATPSQLMCSVNGNTPYALVNNVVNVQVWYGVSVTSGSCNTVGIVCNPDTYMTADLVQAGPYWANVVSARVTVTFLNPLWLQPGQLQYANFTRVIALQSRAI